MIFGQDERDGSIQRSSASNTLGAGSGLLGTLARLFLPGLSLPPTVNPYSAFGTSPPAPRKPLPGDPGYDPGIIPGAPEMHDHLWRDIYPQPRTRFLPAYDTDSVRITPYARQAAPDSGRIAHLGAGAQPQGPAKASRFVDPRTGKFDYWGWLDAGMANIGKGGTLFEDDTPDVMERNAVLDKPAAMIAAGAPENARMPDETNFDTAKAGWD